MLSSLLFKRGALSATRQFAVAGQIFPRSLLTLALVGFSACRAAAADVGDDPEFIRTGEVVVSATRTERRRDEVPTAVESIAEHEIQKRPGQSVPDILRDIPGVTVTDGGGAGIKYIRVRGESTRRTLYLVDGQPVSQQKSMQGGMPLISRNQIERIEVVKGPASVLHGSEAIGGVVNIITKKGGDKPFGGDLSFAYDSSNRGFRHDYGVHGTRGWLEYNLSLGFGSYGDRSTARGKLDHDGMSIRDPQQKRRSGSGSELEDYSVYLGHRSERLHYGLRYDRHDLDYDVYTERTPVMDVYMNLPMSRRRKLSAFFAVADLSENLKKLRLDAFRQLTERDHYIWRDGFKLPPGPAWNFTTTTRTYNEQLTHGGEILSEWQFGAHTIVAGMALTHDDIAGSDRTITRQGPIIFPPGPAFERYVYDADLLTGAVFLQDEWQLSSASRLIGGVRWTQIESELKFTDDPAVAMAQGKSSDSNLAFSLGLVHKLNNRLSLRANYGQGYRYPNLVEAYIGSPPGMGAPLGIAGNPDLKPETSQSFELGGIYQWGAIAAEAALFYTMAKDYITTSATQYINVGGADTLGAELSLAYALGDSGFTPYVSGTWLRRKLDYGTGNAVSSTHDSGVAALSGRGGLRYEQVLGNGLLNVDLFGRLSSSVKLLEADGARSATAGWGTANFEISYLLDAIAELPGQMPLACEIYAGIYNIFDKYYVPFDERPAAGRHVALGLNFKF